jgi:hypothetical protein
VKAKNIVGALVLALAVALPLAMPTIGRIETWKIVLGIAGLILFVRAGMTKA